MLTSITAPFSTPSTKLNSVKTPLNIITIKNLKTMLITPFDLKKTSQQRKIFTIISAKIINIQDQDNTYKLFHIQRCTIRTFF